VLIFNFYEQRSCVVGAEGLLLRGPVTDLYNGLKNKIRTFKKPDPELVYQKGLNICKVKTIWQTDKAVDLNGFYYPSKLLIDDDKIQINSLCDIPPRERIVIQGTAGQGKSIFLRYLSGEELNNGIRIPIFVELMKITHKHSLESLIANSLSELSLNCSVEHVESFLSTLKFSLLLDAFDEVPKDEVKDVILYIERLATKYPELQIVITSRANSDIQNSNLFSIYELAPLEHGDFQPILQKFYDNNQPEIYKILSYLENEAHRIADLITTPLLLTLLCITYNSINKIPPSPYEFYQKLFYLLAERHDSTKPGFRREFTSKLTINKLERLFEAFCFYCLQSDSKTLSYQAAVKKVEDASKLCDISPYSEKAFLDDCVKNTCLLLREGFDYQFIHKSVMEYHAASYIASATTELKSKFYEAAVLKSHLYIEELHYLSYIDQDYYERNYLIPVAKNVLDMMGFDGEHCSINCISEEIEVGFVVRQQKVGLRRLNEFVNVEIPFTHIGIKGCVINTLYEHLKKSVSFEGETIILAMDSSSAYFSDLYRERVTKQRKVIPAQSKIFHFGCIVNPYKNEILKSSLKKNLSRVCMQIHGEFKELENKLTLRDDKIKKIEF
jgi:hypothetical protein